MSTENQTTAQRTDPLEAWLDRVGAVEQWWHRNPRNGRKVTGYLINGQLAIVLRFGVKDGWELFVTASPRNDVTATLDAAALALGIEV